VQNKAAIQRNFLLTLNLSDLTAFLGIVIG